MKTILIIEDDPVIRENLAEILTLAGYRAATSDNGINGVEKAQSEIPDLILCDVRMPELDGFGVLHILARQVATADIPFIFLTAATDLRDFRRGMTLGADDYLTKPIDSDALLRTIEARLHKYDRLRASVQQSPVALETFINEARAIEALRHLSDNRECRHYAKKAVVFNEGEYARWLFFVEKGRVKIFKTSADGRELIVHIAQPGDFIGFFALLKEKPYQESAAALENCELRLIPREDFLRLIFGHRDVSAHFIKLLAGNVSDCEQHLLDLAYNSVRKRVASVLVALSEQSGPHIQMHRDDLAALAGTAKETFVRTLSEFKHEGLVEVREGVLTLLKPEQLRQLQN